MKHMRILAVAILIAMLLPVASVAEELGEVDLYAPEVYDGECGVEAPLEDTADADQPAVDAPPIRITTSESRKFSRRHSAICLRVSSPAACP